MFNLQYIAIELAGSIFSDKLHQAPVTESTNSDAMAGGRRGAAHGSVWVAEEQTAGRGRGDHRWESAAGEGLYVSVLLRLGLPAERLALLPLAAGLAAGDAVRGVTGLKVDLRWPNDLLIGERKFGGILVEAAPGFVVVGMGINVHQRSFPPELSTPATSLDLETGTRVSREAVLIELLRSLEDEVAKLAEAEVADTIPARVAKASSWVVGRKVEVHGPQACAGTTAGLDSNGFLLVETVGGLVTIRTGGIRAPGIDSSTMR